MSDETEEKSKDPNDDERPLVADSSPSEAGDTTGDSEDPPDASTKNVIYYALANIENAFCNQFPYLLNSTLVVAFQIQPLLIGLVLSLKTVIDGITDPIMAHISDNARTRFGRRRPFILIGAAGRLLTIVSIFLFFPATALLLTNEQLAAADKESTEKRAAERAAADAAEEDGVSIVEMDADAGRDAEAQAQVAEQEEKLVAAAEGDQSDAPATAEGEDKPSLLYEKTLKPVVDGFKAFGDPSNAEQRKIVIHIGLGIIIFTLFSTVVSVPYFAMGMELCSSYEGRTKLVVVRSIIDKILMIVNPWMQPLLFATVFYSVVQGFVAVGIFFAIVGIASTLWMVVKVPEPKRYQQIAKKGPKLGFLKSVWLTVENPHFLRVFLLYQVVGFTSTTFVQFAIFLNIYYVMSSATGGSVLTAIGQTLGISLALAALPLMKWISDKFEKHRAILVGVSLMSVGSVLNWWTYTPENPWLQLINPFFFSVGISGFYSIMGALLADVTDSDELRTGQRREGMFAAVMSLMGKVVNSMFPLIAALLLTVSGFDPALKFDQEPETFVKMRMLYAFAPLIPLSIGIYIAATYPLTRKKMAEIKAELKVRRQRDRAEASGEA